MCASSSSSSSQTLRTEAFELLFDTAVKPVLKNLSIIFPKGGLFKSILVYDEFNSFISLMLDYANNAYINIKTAKFLEAVYTGVSKNGIPKTINKSNLKKLYQDSLV